MTQDYGSIKNASVLVPSTVQDLGTPCKPYGNIYVKNSVSLNAGNGIGNVTSFSATTLAVPKIQSVSYPGSETAANPAGGETITINGSGFLSGLGVYLNSNLLNTSTVVNSNQITFNSPALAAGNYSLSVVNSDGGSATYLFGVSYANVPVWTTTAGSLGSAHEGNVINTSVAATDGAQTITYSVTTGSLPTGLSLASNGTISGTLANSASGNTTYNFTLGATDPQNQVVTRNFSYTVAGDTLTWSSPSSGTIFTESAGVAISNISLSATSAFGSSVTYTATSLPTGLTISGSNITGTPTTVANSTVTLTATTSTKQVSESVTFNVLSSGYSVTYFAVAGGGGSNSNWGGGGGAGGIVCKTISIVGGTSYTIIVGAGGNQGANGSNTSISGGTLTAANYTALGGGYSGRNCGSHGGCGASGGSGGGGSGGQCHGGTGGSGLQPSSTAGGYGNNGGKGSQSTGGAAAAGGGGAGAVGQSLCNGSGKAGNGGAGKQYTQYASWYGSPSGWFAGGGGGGGNGAGCGGNGGGGNGGGGRNQGSAGTAGTGGGAGGGGYCGSGGNSGGSGIVIISYQSATQKGTGGTVTSSGSGASTYWYHAFTTSGTYTYTG